MKRIIDNEKRLDTLNNIVLNLDKDLTDLENNLNEYYKLNNYYGSKNWLKDKEDFENGKINNIKAGVLSEDAVWNLDEDINDLLIRMNKLIELVNSKKEQ
jgi:hypothetical protein